MKKCLIRRTRGRRALESAARDLHYEWAQAHISAEFAKLARKKRNQKLENTAVESFLIHARAIGEFFGKKGRPNDVLARDYLGHSPRVRLPYTRKNKKRIDRRIAHLSYSRPRMSPDWPLDLMIEEIDRAMRLFVGRLKKRGLRALPKIITG